MNSPLRSSALGTQLSVGVSSLSLFALWLLTVYVLNQRPESLPRLMQTLLPLTIVLSLLLSVTVATLVGRLLRQIKQREATLQASEAFKNTVLDAVAAEVAVVDRLGRIVATNAPWQRFAEENTATGDGTPSFSMIGANYFDVCQVDSECAEAADASAAHTGMMDVLEGRLTSFSMDYPCDSPSERRWFTMVVHPLGEKACDGLVVTHFDVTRIKEAEATAQQRLNERRKAEEESNKLLQAIEQSPISMFITDTAGVIEYANPRFMEVTGYSRSELIGRTPAMLNSGKTANSTYESLWHSILAGKGWRGVLCNQIRNGTMIWEDTSVSPIFNEAGQATHFAVVKEDVTERLRIERELAEHQLRLEELVEQRTAELSRALEAAQVADRMKNEFLANITHELRTPLSAVIGFSDLARPLSSDAQQREYLDKVICSGKTLAATIDDLLDLSKIAAGCLKFEAKPFSIRALVARCNSVISYQAVEKGLLLQHDVDDAVPAVLIGDALRIEQIVLNLLSNAVKFTDRGSVGLQIGVQSILQGRMCLQLDIRDTGIGMRDDEIALLFQPFSQADSSVTRRFGGTGLGLAICARLAKMMDGEIRVTSAVGVGTHFRVQLWVECSNVQEILLEEPRREDIRQIRYRNTRALIVDDQPFNRELVTALLKAVGISPYTAANGQEALDFMTSDPDDFDIILMDIQMPVMDGRTATRELRNMPRFTRIPIIAMTAHTMLHERERSFLAGMNDHVGKPFNEQSFYQVLARWIPPAQQFKAEPVALIQKVPEIALQLPEIAGIESKESIRLMQGDVGRYLHWLREFLDSGPTTVHQIRAAMEIGDRDSASMAAHRLRGRSGFLGMHETHALSSALETAIDGGKDCDALVNELECKVSQLCEGIQEQVGSG